jgi:hypothetical protein
MSGWDFVRPMGCHFFRVELKKKKERKKGVQATLSMRVDVGFQQGFALKVICLGLSLKWP